MLAFGSLSVVASRGGCNGLQKCGQNMWEGAYWEGVLLCLDPWDVLRLRTSSSYWNVPGKYGPHSELFFFLVKKELVAFTKAVPFKPVVPAETLKACALIGSTLLAAEGEAGSSGSQYPDLGDTQKKISVGLAAAQRDFVWENKNKRTFVKQERF